MLQHEGFADDSAGAAGLQHQQAGQTVPATPENTHATYNAVFESLRIAICIWEIVVTNRPSSPSITQPFSTCPARGLIF